VRYGCDRRSRPKGRFCIFFQWCKVIAVRQISEEQFQQLIEAGYESRNLEFRDCFLWHDDNRYMRERLVRSILGLANTQDGGHIILGIAENPDKSLRYEGCPEEVISSFVFDSVKGVVDGFGDHGVDFDMAVGKHGTGQFLVIQVSEFEEFPVICKKDGQIGSDGKRQLVRGSVYVRTMQGQPATDVVMEKEMRNIIERAIDKGRRKLERRGWTHEGSDVEKFNKMRGGF